MVAGTVWLIPTTLGGESAAAVLPAGTLERLSRLNFFLAENPKSARAFLKLAGYPAPISATRIELLDNETPIADMDRMLDTVASGTDAGVLSEAGCPAVADPGARLVRRAHARHLRVVPLSGPSSITLALMASGLETQRFAFHGYLPVKEPAREQAIRRIEERSRMNAETQIFIETPYRNVAILGALLKACRADTLLCIACNLTLPDESIVLRSIRDWRDTRMDFDKKPCVFLLLAKLETA